MLATVELFGWRQCVVMSDRARVEDGRARCWHCDFHPNFAARNNRVRDVDRGNGVVSGDLGPRRLNHFTGLAKLGHDDIESGRLLAVLLAGVDHYIGDHVLVKRYGRLRRDASAGVSCMYCDAHAILRLATNVTVAGRRSRHGLGTVDSFPPRRRLELHCSTQHRPLRQFAKSIIHHTGEPKLIGVRIITVEVVELPALSHCTGQWAVDGYLIFPCFSYHHRVISAVVCLVAS
ncbi:hypothetical protein D3C77_204470 [compost metagenome]